MSATERSRPGSFSPSPDQSTTYRELAFFSDDIAFSGHDEVMNKSRANNLSQSNAVLTYKVSLLMTFLMLFRDSGDRHFPPGAFYFHNSNFLV